MKKIILLSLIIAFAIGLNAQTSKKDFSPAFVSAMQANIKQLDTAVTAATLITVANNFERIANSEKTKWEPFYYAAYSYTIMAFMSPDKTKIDWLADKAEGLLQQAAAIEKNNSEISVMFAMINSCRIMVDPVSRFQTRGPEIQSLLAKATQENVNNPRIYLQQARMQIRTPEAFGGGKIAAKKSTETAIEKFKNFTPENSIAPAWGESQAISLLEKLMQAINQ